MDISALNDDMVHAAKAMPDESDSSGTLPILATQPAAFPCIHFTVRILMSERKQGTPLLSHLSTIKHGKNIAWTDVTGTRGFFEEPPTAWESWMFRQWIKREEEMFGKEMSSSFSGGERFTRFLYPFRREGERPRRAFYSPAPRASSTDRSSEIKDANDMLEERMEKIPDLSQSHSSAATSVGSGVKYYVDLDYEGYFPERFGRMGNGTLARRELQLGALYLARRPTFSRKVSTSMYEGALE